MPRPDLDELERRVARTGATVDNVSDLLGLARELEAENQRLLNAARLGKACLPLGGCVGAYHAGLRADLDAARAELAQRGELVGWVVVRPDATRRFCVPNIQVYPSPETAAAAADLKRARYPQVAYFVAEVRALAGEGNGADNVTSGPETGRGAPNGTPVDADTREGLSEAERGEE